MLGRNVQAFAYYACDMPDRQNALIHLDLNDSFSERRRDSEAILVPVCPMKLYIILGGPTLLL